MMAQQQSTGMRSGVRAVEKQLSMCPFHTLLCTQVERGITKSNIFKHQRESVLQ